MITVSLEKPLAFDQNGEKVSLTAFDLRPPVWADEKAITKAHGGLNFDGVMQRIAEPIGVDIPVTEAMLDRLSVWDAAKLMAAYKPFFTHPDTLEAEVREQYGPFVKQS